MQRRAREMQRVVHRRLLGHSLVILSGRHRALQERFGVVDDAVAALLSAMQAIGHINTSRTMVLRIYRWRLNYASRSSVTRQLHHAPVSPMDELPDQGLQTLEITEHADGPSVSNKHSVHAANRQKSNLYGDCGLFGKCEVNLFGNCDLFGECEGL